MKRFSYERTDIQPLTRDVCPNLRDAVIQRGFARLEWQRAKRMVQNAKLDAILEAWNLYPIGTTNRTQLIAIHAAETPAIASAQADYDAASAVYEAWVAEVKALDALVSLETRRGKA
jgi:hypothetical protein